MESRDVSVAAGRLREGLAEASRGLIEREALVELIALAAVAGEHVLVLGPPGTAKSEAVRRAARGLGGRYFEYLLGRFTEPGELFGPVDLRRLREGVVAVETAGMLPEAEVAFLDEVFLGSTAILNTLLGILNERTFRRGSTRLACPLRVCVGASNSLPDDDSLAPFADRFLVRAFLDRCPTRASKTSSRAAGASTHSAARHHRRPASTTSTRSPTPRAPSTSRRCGPPSPTPSGCCAGPMSRSPTAGPCAFSASWPPPRCWPDAPTPPTKTSGPCSPRCPPARGKTPPATCSAPCSRAAATPPSAPRPKTPPPAPSPAPSASPATPRPCSPRGPPPPPRPRTTPR
jgi:hypothetical protein